MKYALLLCLLVPPSLCLASEPNALHHRLASDTTIQGYPCARGEVWFYPDGSLNQCTLSRPAAVGNDVRVPRGSVVELWPNGATQYLMLRRPAVLGGYRVRGSARHGDSRGAATTFYRTGELRSIYLLSNQTIQGVPCRGASWNSFADPASGENMVEFYRDGRLESCRLSHDFSGFRAWQRIVFPRLTSYPPTRAELTSAGSAQ